MCSLALRIGILLAFLWPFLSLSADRLDAYEDDLRHWLTLQHQLRDTRQAWEAEAAILRDEAALLQARLQQLHQQLDAQRQATTEATARASAATEASTNQEAPLLHLRDAVDQASTRLRAWHARLPPPLKAQLLAPIQAIPPATEQHDATRLRALLDALAAARELTAAFHVGSMTLTDPQGDERHVQVLFAGTAIGYATTLDHSFAAIGTLGPDGWSWQPAIDHATTIARAIAMVRDNAPAAFLRLPIYLQRDGETP